MRVLTKSEATTFLAEHSLQDSLTRPHPAKTEFTSDVGKRCAFANLLTNHLVTAQDSLACLNITDWAVWPSSQNMDLFYAYRKSLGEHRLLLEAHFHVFEAHEAKELRNILHLALISLFDVAGASTTTDFTFYASHDEWIDLAWQDGADWKDTMNWFFTP